MSADEEGYAAPRVHDHRAEVALLSACLASKTARQEARRIITGADLWEPVHEVVWSAMNALDRDGTLVDLVTVNAACGSQRGVGEVLIAASEALSMPDAAAEYAGIVRGWATRRRVGDAGRQMVQRSTDLSLSPAELAVGSVRLVTSIRDAGSNQDVTALTLRELMTMEEPDKAPTWVIPDLMESEDRLMLTGTEGAGKSALSRQLGVMAAAGIHPFSEAIMPPIKVAIIDCENKRVQVRRQLSPLLQWLRNQGEAVSDPMDRVMIDTCGRIDILRDRDLGRIHMLLDSLQPDLVVIGPLYKMTPRAIQNDDEAAPMLAALDTITERGCALILEAHAGHGAASGNDRRPSRDLRPRGSSALLGWPEFGLGLRAHVGTSYADLEPWRGHREKRFWPTRVERAPGNRWVEAPPM